MKTVRAAFTAATLGLCVSSMAGMVRAEADVDITDLFYTYSKDNIVTDYYSEDYLYATKQLENKVYSGFLALKQIDLNWDGQEELLAIRMKPLEENEPGSRLVAEIYEYEGNKLQRIAQTELADDVLMCNSVNADVFLIHTDYGEYLGCEDKETASIFADGTDWTLKIVSFDGSNFQTITDTGILGSAWEHEDLAEAWQGLNNLGIYPEELIFTPISDQSDQVTLLNRINRYEITDHQQITDFLNAPDAESMLYGETLFYSYCNEGLANKIQGDFESVRYMEDIQDVMAPDSFMIPDSNSRFITEDDLGALTEFEILVARNEIYARHGRMFKNAELQNYFNSKSWYQPTVSGEAFTESYAASVFNEYELRNIDTIVKYEREHNLNQG